MKTYSEKLHAKTYTLAAFGEDDLIQINTIIGEYVVSLWLESGKLGTHYYAIHKQTGERVSQSFTEKIEAIIYATSLDAGVDSNRALHLAQSTAILIVHYSND